MDDADRAGPEIDRNIAEAMLHKKPTGPTPNGRCHWCDEIVSDEARWCSHECMADWNRAVQAQRRSGASAEG